MDNKVQYFYIDEEEAGQRLDNYLLKKLKGVPRSFIYKIIRGGEVRVNKKRAKPLQKIVAADAIRVPPVRTRDEQVISSAELMHDKWAWLESQIIYEEDAYLVLNKPAGVAVHGGSGINLGAIEMLHKIRPDCKALELGHRLDKDTSGCLVIAKKRSFLRAFHELLREKKAKKEYLTLLAGKWSGKKVREVNVPLLKTTTASGERIVRINHAEGKSAKTSFELIQNFEDACLVKARPLTGRTHQIRVHALSMGQPVIGDEKYGDDALNKKMKDRGCPRLCLHAEALRFSITNDKGEKKDYHFEAPLDEKIQKFMKNLKRIS